MRLAWPRVACLTLLLAMSASLASGSPDDAEARRIALGVYAPGIEQRTARIDHYAQLMGHRPLIVSYYKQWDFDPFVKRELKNVWSQGAVPMITWEPLSYHGRHYSLRGIARGRYGRYVRGAARAAAAARGPIFLRFAHEMNGDWYPWGRGVHGNTPHRFKIAWRRLVRIFRRAGANNVRWVWAPNINQFGGLPFKRYFPGDRWVDWVGLDGFNWGSDGRSYSFKQLFADSYRTLVGISSRPVVIAEMGTYERGKARWISQALRRQMPRMRRIKAFLWFNDPVNGVQLRFNASRASLRALRTATRLKRYRAATRRWLLGAAPLAGRR